MALLEIPDDFGQGGANIGDGEIRLVDILKNHSEEIADLEAGSVDTTARAAAAAAQSTADGAVSVNTTQTTNITTAQTTANNAASTAAAAAADAAAALSGAIQVSELTITPSSFGPGPLDPTVAFPFPVIPENGCFLSLNMKVDETFLDADENPWSLSGIGYGSIGGGAENFFTGGLTLDATTYPTLVRMALSFGEALTKVGTTFFEENTTNPTLPVAFISVPGTIPPSQGSVTFKVFYFLA